MYTEFQLEKVQEAPDLKQVLEQKRKSMLQELQKRLEKCDKDLENCIPNSMAELRKMPKATGLDPVKLDSNYDLDT